jgi:hypothetical protein
MLMFFRANMMFAIHMKEALVNLSIWDMPCMQDAFICVMSVSREVVLLNLAILFLERMISFLLSFLEMFADFMLYSRLLGGITAYSIIARPFYSSDDVLVMTTMTAVAAVEVEVAAVVAAMVRVAAADGSSSSSINIEHFAHILYIVLTLNL